MWKDSFAKSSPEGEKKVLKKSCAQKQQPAYKTKIDNNKTDLGNNIKHHETSTSAYPISLGKTQ